MSGIEFRTHLLPYCDVCQRHVVDMVAHIKTGDHKRNQKRIGKLLLPTSFNFIDEGTLTCPTCEGRLFWEAKDKEWRCVNCGRPALSTSQIKQIKPVPTPYVMSRPRQPRKSASVVTH